MLAKNEPDESFNPEQLSLLSAMDLRERIIEQSLYCSVQQCRYVDLLFSDVSIKACDAYEAAGYSCPNRGTATAGAAKLKRVKSVARLIKLRTEEARQASCITTNFIIGHQLNMMKKSAEADLFGTSSKIAVEVAKLTGIYKENDEATEGAAGIIDANDLSDDEWEAIINANAQIMDKAAT